MIVDTSNEIAGDGDTPHREAIGESRRIMVPNKKEQHRYSSTHATAVVDDTRTCIIYCIDLRRHPHLYYILKN